MYQGMTPPSLQMPFVQCGRHSSTTRTGTHTSDARLRRCPSQRWLVRVRRSSLACRFPRGCLFHMAADAVVIQEQVIAVAAGVVFTVNPSNANATQSGLSHVSTLYGRFWQSSMSHSTLAVLESVWGLGEGLVSGEISPHTCVVDWSGSTEGRAADCTLSMPF